MAGRKGISPLIAAVLLIAFTMSVAMLFGQWAPQLLKGAMGDTSEEAAEVVDCSQARISLMQVRQEGNNGIEFSFQVKGDTELDNFTAGLFNDAGRARAEKITTSGLKNSEIKTVSLSTPDTGKRFTRLELSSNSCPNQVEEEIKLDCPSGFAGINALGGFCIMKYEASRKDATASSAGTSSVAASQQGVVPWTNIDQSGAQSACRAMGSGYNLTSNKQWQAATGAVIGEPSTFVHGNNDYGKSKEDSSETCTDDPTRSGDNRCLTGTGPSSWSTSQGVADLNGNVWEWTRNFHGDGSSWDLESDGHVNAWSQVDERPTQVNGANSSFDDDYYWAPDDGSSDGAVLRGGAWNNGRDAGPFAMNLGAPPSFSHALIGFRCSY